MNVFPRPVPIFCFHAKSGLAILNFVTVGMYVQIVGNDGEWEYAQGFWMTICSACLSTLCALLIAINTFLVPDLAKRGKMGLSGPQRVFVIQIMFFIVWMAVSGPLPY